MIYYNDQVKFFLAVNAVWIFLLKYFDFTFYWNLKQSIVSKKRIQFIITYLFIYLFFNKYHMFNIS